MAKRYSIKVIGAFDVLDRNLHSLRPPGRKDCALIAMLALTRNHRQTRTWLQERLWGDRGPAQAAASLRQSLTVLRGMLNSDEEVLCADRTWIWLDPAFLDFDHVAPGARGEILRGFDLKEEGFNDWLRDVRVGFDGPSGHWEGVEAAQQTDRRWFLDSLAASEADPATAALCDLVNDSLFEALSVIGLPTAINRRGDIGLLVPRATDMVARIRAVRFGGDSVLSLSVTDGFGSLWWQVRREVALSDWPAVRAAQIEMAQLFQDFAIRTEADRLRGSRWSAYANGCHALMGVLVPGSMPLRDIAQCSEAAIAADEKGVYHALLGVSRLLLYGEREAHTAMDADEVMQSFRTALRLAPGNGLVQALVGHSYGFLQRDLDRNAAMTREAVRQLPGSGPCWIFHAISQVYCGRYAEAVATAEVAVALCRGTMAQPMALSTQLFARLMAGDTAGAIRAGERSLDGIVFRPTIVDLMTAYAAEGRIEDGRAKLAQLVRREPNLSLEMLRSDSYPIVNHTHRGRVIEAARRLGLK